MLADIPHRKSQYHIVSLVWWGRTIGKTVFSLRVISTSGNKLSWKQAILRWFIAALPTYGADDLKALQNTQKQTWHDMFARTIVVQEQVLSAPQKAILLFALLGLLPAIIVTIIIAKL